MERRALLAVALVEAVAVLVERRALLAVALVEAVAVLPAKVVAVPWRKRWMWISDALVAAALFVVADCGRT